MDIPKAVRWSRYAYRHRDYILENLREERVSPATFVITRARKPNLFEIHSTAWLFGPYREAELARLPEIVGIGYGERDTLQLVQKLVEEALR